MNRVDAKFGSVQETLLIPLCGRAAEQTQPEPIVRDPQAAELVAAIDYDFDRLRKFRRSMVGCCVRAWVFDRWIQRFLAESPDGVVVEVGPGLDSCFDRNDNGRVVWYEIDFADVIDVRRQFFAENDRRRVIVGSALETGWVADVQAQGGPYLFLAAGVLLYFTEAEVRQFFSLIAGTFPGSLCVFDACTPWARKTAAKLEPAVRLTQAEFRWAIDDPRDIERWDSRFQVLEVDYYLNHFRHRWPLWLRVWSRLFPATRRNFTLNRARIN